MPAPRDRPHLFVASPSSVEPFSRKGGSSLKIPPPLIGRPAHSHELSCSLDQAQRDADARRNACGISVSGATSGLYIEIDSRPNITLATTALQSLPNGIEVTNQKDITVNIGKHEALVQRATIFVPDGKLAYFFKRLDAYGLSAPKAYRERRYEDTFDRIAELRLATLRALWTDDEDDYPDDITTTWWEIWL